MQNLANKYSIFFASCRQFHSLNSVSIAIKFKAFSQYDVNHYLLTTSLCWPFKS